MTMYVCMYDYAMNNYFHRKYAAIIENMRG